MALLPADSGDYSFFRPSRASLGAPQKRKMAFIYGGEGGAVGDGDDNDGDNNDDNGPVDVYCYPSERSKRPFRSGVYFYSDRPHACEPSTTPECPTPREEPPWSEPCKRHGTVRELPQTRTAKVAPPATGLDRVAFTELLEDVEAAKRVGERMASFRLRSPGSSHERILKSIIQPRPRVAEYTIDNEALRSIFSAANEIFFSGRLSQRVTWDWSHSAYPQYDNSVIGTTAFRRTSEAGFETLIVLSSHILRDTQYSRRLLISTFLHELIHSYLFICCGSKAGASGGHTPGFHTIAGLIDDWAGPDSLLYLTKTEADLECFRAREEPERAQSTHIPHYYVYPCSGAADGRLMRPCRSSGRGEYVYGRDWWAIPNARSRCRRR